MSDYDPDNLVRSEHQAELLRRRAAGELVDDMELDWPNISPRRSRPWGPSPVRDVWPWTLGNRFGADPYL